MAAMSEKKLYYELHVQIFKQPGWAEMLLHYKNISMLLLHSNVFS